jgi:hypothetical protein
MRFSENFNPEWGYLSPAPGFMRTVRIAVVAAAVGAIAGGGVVISLVVRPDAEEASIAARTLIEPDGALPPPVAVVPSQIMPATAAVDERPRKPVARHAPANATADQAGPTAVPTTTPVARHTPENAPAEQVGAVPAAAPVARHAAAAEQVSPAVVPTTAPVVRHASANATAEQVGPAVAPTTMKAVAEVPANGSAVDDVVAEPAVKAAEPALSQSAGASEAPPAKAANRPRRVVVQQARPAAPAVKSPLDLLRSFAARATTWPPRAD